MFIKLYQELKERKEKERERESLLVRNYGYLSQPTN